MKVVSGRLRASLAAAVAIVLRVHVLPAQCIHIRRFVEVHGERGIGKSTLLNETGRFLFLRLDSFVEVRWVESGSSDERVRHDCIVGLQCLRQRLTANPSGHRVLLLVDELEAGMWCHIQPLLRFSNVHMALAMTSPQVVQMAESDASAGVNASGLSLAAHAAMASGLKPITFEVGPLEPLARVRLFLQRAPRPLSMAELECKPPHGPGAVLQPPQKPIEFLRLSESPLFTQLGGNPSELVSAAARLGLAAPVDGNISHPVPRAFSADASAGPCRQDVHQLPVEMSCNGGLPPATRRKVRLLRPDGRAREEWLPRAVHIAKVVEDFCPKGICGTQAVVFIAGCHAPPDALLGDFPDDEKSGLLILQFRNRCMHDDEW